MIGFVVAAFVAGAASVCFLALAVLPSRFFRRERPGLPTRSAAGVVVQRIFFGAIAAMTAVAALLFGLAAATS